MPIEFEENDPISMPQAMRVSNEQPSFFIRMLLKFRIASNEYAARAILLITATIFLVGSIVLFTIIGIQPKSSVVERSLDPRDYVIDSSRE